MKAWQAVSITVGLLVAAGAIAYQKPDTTSGAPEEIKIYRYYNEDSQVECFYHQNAISCLWVMDGGK